MGEHLWRDAHDRLVEYHAARGRGAVRSTLDRYWQSYLAARQAAEAAGRPADGINYEGPDPSVECAYPPCANRLRRSDFPGPQWCSKAHRAATEVEVAVFDGPSGDFIGMTTTPAPVPPAPDGSGGE